MGPLRSRWARGVLLWTLALLVVAIGLAILASASLIDAQQRCFVDFPSVACPDGQDWRVGLLTFAFVGVPLVWVVGLIVSVAGRAASKRRRESRR